MGIFFFGARRVHRNNKVIIRAIDCGCCFLTAVIRSQYAQKAIKLLLMKDTTFRGYFKLFLQIDQEVMIAKVELFLA
jgi:hypothetical protein